MHFEVPKAKSFKEFGGEYLMIVVSIITALALEHFVQSIHHRHLAEEASAKLDAEISANVQQIGEALAQNEQRVKKLIVVRDELLDGIRNKVDDAVLLERFKKEKDTHGLSIQTPTLRREAWEAAIANQAVTWMRPEALERYSTAYASMRDAHVQMVGGSFSFIDGPRWRDTASDVQIGLATPREVFRMLNQMISAYGSLDGNLEWLQRELAKPRTN